MLINKTLYIETSQSEYRVELEIDVLVTPSDYSNDASDWDFYGYTELADFRIISVQKRTCVQKPSVPRQKKDWLTYKWTEVLMGDLSSEEQQELNEQINKEITSECNC